MTVEEIHSIVESFGKGALNAKRAGFDGVEIHAVHEGYLIDQFAISFFDHRTDEYGGSLENRLRFAKEIREEIARTCGWDFPVAMRFSLKSMVKDFREGALPGESFEEKGRDIEEGIQAAKLLEQYGYDALDVDAGTYDAWWWNHPPMYMEGGFDAVIVATGSRPKMFPLGDDDKVYTAEQVLLGEKETGDRVVVVGAGLVGCELALDLAMKGKQVTIVEALDKIMAVNGPLCSANRDMLERLIPFYGVKTVCGARVTGFREGELHYELNNSAEVLPADSVVLCVGYRSENAIYEALKYDIDDLYLVGDAKQVSNIMYAIWDAFEVANHL